jgi:hypothetical protein
LERLIVDVEPKGTVEFRPRQEGNTLHLILAPKKEGAAQGHGQGKDKPKAAKPPAQQQGGQAQATQAQAPAKPAVPPASQGGAQTA